MQKVSIRSKLQLHEGQIPLGQLIDIQTAWDLAESILSRLKHLKARQDSMAQLEKKATSDANRLRDISSEVIQEKEAKHKEELGLAIANSRILELENELRNAVVEKDRFTWQYFGT